MLDHFYRLSLVTSSIFRETVVFKPNRGTVYVLFKLGDPFQHKSRSFSNYLYSLGAASLHCRQGLISNLITRSENINLRDPENILFDTNIGRFHFIYNCQLLPLPPPQRRFYQVKFKLPHEFAIVRFNFIYQTITVMPLSVME